MSQPAGRASLIALVGFGLASLAAAMGIGRFAFTPMLPLMQQHDGVSLAQGAWLAAANYLGYLAGALASYVVVPSASRAIRLGLLAVAASTAAMAATTDLSLWLALRFAAGLASAFVLVGVSGRALAALGAAGRADLAGWVFAGVGTGIVFAGLVVMSLAAAGVSTGTAWLLFGAAALAVALAGWPVWSADTDGVTSTAAATRAAPAPAGHLDAREWTLVVAYGGFGLGYIITATFLPAMARALVADPAVFGWAWPIFGAAAAASTVIVTRTFTAAPPRTVFIASVLVMAAGVIVPALTATLWAIVVSALCVGGTFMVATMAGFQEARRIGRAAPARLIAAMTASFALGQLGGPLLVGLWSGSRDPVLVPSLIAVAVLLASAALLLFRAPALHAAAGPAARSSE